jgi:hypothetical protein
VLRREKRLLQLRNGKTAESQATGALRGAQSSRTAPRFFRLISAFSSPSA